MKYLLECCNEEGLTMQISIEPTSQIDFLRIDLNNAFDHMTIYLEKNDVFDLIGILHHIQKKMK